MAVWDVYTPLLQRAVAITDLQQESSAADIKRRRRKEIEGQIAEHRNKFDEEAKSVFNASRKPGESFTDISALVREQLSTLKEQAQAHADAARLSVAIDYMSDRMSSIAVREQGKSPARRWFERYWWAVAIPGVAAIYFGSQFYFLVPVYDGIDAVESYHAGGEALAKVARYDDWASTSVRRGGWLMGPLLWPIEPTEPEITFAADYVSWIREMYGFGRQEGDVCGPALIDDSASYEDFIEQSVAISDALLAGIDAAPPEFQEPIARAYWSLIQTNPC